MSEFGEHSAVQIHVTAQNAGSVQNRAFGAPRRECDPTHHSEMGTILHFATAFTLNHVLLQFLHVERDLLQFAGFRIE